MLVETNPKIREDDRDAFMWDSEEWSHKITDGTATLYFGDLTPFKPFPQKNLGFMTQGFVLLDKNEVIDLIGKLAVLVGANAVIVKETS